MVGPDGGKHVLRDETRAMSKIAKKMGPCQEFFVVVTRGIFEAK